MSFPPDLVTIAKTTITPTGAMIAEVSDTSLSLEFLKLWFIQSIEPLVGQDAAGELQTLMDANPSDRDAFLNTAKTFRETFLPVAE